MTAPLQHIIWPKMLVVLRLNNLFYSVNSSINVLPFESNSQSYVWILHHFFISGLYKVQILKTKLDLVTHIMLLENVSDFRG